MTNKKRRAARPDPWETGELGNDERYVRRVSAAEEARIEAALGLRMISIRLPEHLIEELKVIAVHRGIGYQPLMRNVLSRFARGEVIQVLRHQAEIAELKKRKDAAARPKGRARTGASASARRFIASDKTSSDVARHTKRLLRERFRPK